MASLPAMLIDENKELKATNDDLASHIGEMRLLMEQMAEALKECADDLESEVIARNPTIAGEQEIMKRRRTRDLLPVQSARSALSAYERVRKLYSIETAPTEVRKQAGDVS